jgi:hypothetical protein
MGNMKRVFAVLVVVVGATTFVSAKGFTTRIEITSAQYHTSVEITDPEILKNFNVWSGPGTFVNDVEATEGFIIDWTTGAVPERPRGLSSYEVSFSVKYANRSASEQKDQLAYRVFYATDPSSGEGYVYLPGKGDEPYRLNTNAIFRGREGNWFHATAAWQSTVDRLIAQAH